MQTCSLMTTVVLMIIVVVNMDFLLVPPATPSGLERIAKPDIELETVQWPVLLQLAL